MALNPNIILAGRPVDVVGAMDAGAIAGQRAREFQNANALSGFMRERGDAVLRNDADAVSALAQMGTEGLQMAQGVQGNALNMEATRLEMDQTRQSMSLARKQDARLDRAEEMKIAEYAQSIGAEKAAQEAEQIKQAVSGGLAAQTPEQWDAFVGSMAPDLVGQFEKREMIAQQYLSVADALERNAAPDTTFDPDRFRVVGSTLFDLNAEGGPAPVGEGQTQEEVIYGPDGKPIVSRGPTGTSAKLTEGQSKDIGFAARARDALDTINSVDSTELTSRTQQIADAVPMGLGRGIQSDDFQVAKNAGTQFLLAILRKDTGAAVTPSEEQMYGDAFLPRPGDGDELLAQKARAREIAISSLEEGMTPEAILAQGRAIARADAAGGAAAMPEPSRVTAADIQAMSPEDLSQYMLNLDVTQLPDDVLEAIMARGE